MDGGWLYASRFINNVFALRDVSLGNLLGILPSTILAFDVMIVVGTGWWRQIRYFPSLRLYHFHLSHSFHRVLQLFALNLPLRIFLWFGVHRLFRRRRWGLLCFLYSFSLAYFLMLHNTVTSELPTTPPTFLQLLVDRALARPLQIVTLLGYRNGNLWLLLIGVLSGTLGGFLDHRANLTSLLMRFQ